MPLSSQHTPEPVRVRFAPSPTGYLHIGGARTALFNWIYARQSGGAFVLRIEDTDLARSSTEMTEGILAGLSWLGIDWDEGPYLQSDRLSLYRLAGARLLAEGKAYACFCTPAQLEERRSAHPAGGPPWKYDRRCRNLPVEERERRLAAGELHALRFLVPDGSTVFDDRVYGTVRVENHQLEDFVLLRSDQMPTYHLSVVTDDIDMRISHIIRGADHLANTGKQVLLYQALGASLPVFAHVPLILGSDKKRLSKRHGATSVTAYRDMGIVPAALVNFLCLLGWSPGKDRELMPLEEIIASFRLEDINKSNAVFDLQKLEWMNSKYIAELSLSSLVGLLKPALAARGLWRSDLEDGRSQWFASVIELLRPRSKTLNELADSCAAFLTDTFDYEPEARDRYLRRAGIDEALQNLIDAYRKLDSFDLAGSEAALRAIASHRGLKAGDLIGAVRVALTGRGVAPGLFETMMVLGRGRTLSRLERAVETIHAL